MLIGQAMPTTVLLSSHTMLTKQSGTHWLEFVRILSFPGVITQFSHNNNTEQLHNKVPKSCVPIIIYLLFYVHCQDYVYHSYGIATPHWHAKVLFIYPLINSSSKKTTENRHSTYVR